MTVESFPLYQVIRKLDELTHWLDNRFAPTTDKKNGMAALSEAKDYFIRAERARQNYHSSTVA